MKVSDRGTALDLLFVDLFSETGLQKGVVFADSAITFMNSDKVIPLAMRLSHFLESKADLQRFIIEHIVYHERYDNTFNNAKRDNLMTAFKIKLDQLDLAQPFKVPVDKSFIKLHEITGNFLSEYVVDVSSNQLKNALFNTSYGNSIKSFLEIMPSLKSKQQKVVDTMIARIINIIQIDDYICKVLDTCRTEISDCLNASLIELSKQLMSSSCVGALVLAEYFAHAAITNLKYNSDAYYNLGEIYMRLDSREKALLYFQQAAGDRSDIDPYTKMIDIYVNNGDVTKIRDIIKYYPELSKPSKKPKTLSATQKEYKEAGMFVLKKYAELLINSQQVDSSIFNEIEAKLMQYFFPASSVTLGKFKGQFIRQQMLQQPDKLSDDDINNQIINNGLLSIGDILLLLAHLPMTQYVRYAEKMREIFYASYTEETIIQNVQSMIVAAYVFKDQPNEFDRLIAISPLSNKEKSTILYYVALDAYDVTEYQRSIDQQSIKYLLDSISLDPQSEQSVTLQKVLSSIDVIKDANISNEVSVLEHEVNELKVAQNQGIEEEKKINYEQNSSEIKEKSYWQDPASEHRYFQALKKAAKYMLLNQVDYKFYGWQFGKGYIKSQNTIKLLPDMYAAVTDAVATELKQLNITTKYYNALTNGFVAPLHENGIKVIHSGNTKIFSLKVNTEDIRVLSKTKLTLPNEGPSLIIFDEIKNHGNELSNFIYHYVPYSIESAYLSPFDNLDSYTAMKVSILGDSSSIE